MKKFLYLVQCNGKESVYRDTMTDDADILYLSWKYEHEDMIHYPESTWTEGRNTLYQEALKLN